ncbi:flagellar hook-associated protein FlgL [Sediminicurvatus halobius]|uniref:Flagellar hook-associated protein 3 n=1 Tax=Sediminicurvatus halobius TaxID=2182432 RepID=A0A2U2N011_9GAMM|nr:flagellar hook-associated protein FlgL [Spiribacter halobius]PWG62304.1 flagellar hook-associated protein 3 [Spiribacter halobius]UEX79775.1 flagellar hook-associated protein FlgL [Spiribacter halobius]
MRISTPQIQQTGVNALLDQQGRLSKVQEQLATGRRILNPSDDPSGSARALELAKSVETIERYNRNIDFAESRMRVEEGVLEQVGNSITRIRELAVQANNATTGDDGRQKIGAEIRERLDQLVQLANSTDGDGEYLFAGSQSREKPFVREGDKIVYQGDQTSRFAQVGPGRQIATTHSGYETFMAIFNGDGEYATSAADANSGSGIISGVDVVDASQTPDAPYTIEFADNGGGGLDYTVTDNSGGTAASGTYEAGTPIQFDGLSVTVEGTPDGTTGSEDTFTVAPSSRQSLFETVGRFADALENARDGAAANAEFLNIGNRTLEDLDQAQSNILQVRTELGGRLNALDSEKQANETAVLELKTTRSEIEDLDYASAVSDLSLRLTGLQAAQRSFSQIQGLSLFQFL